MLFGIFVTATSRMGNFLHLRFGELSFVAKALQPISIRAGIWNRARPHLKTHVLSNTHSLCSVQNSPLGSVPKARGNVDQGHETWDGNMLGHFGG